MKSLSNLPKATPESVWAVLQEVSQMNKEVSQLNKEVYQLNKESAQVRKETERIMKENSIQIKELQKTVGGITNNQGFFAEEYFFNSFEKGKKNFFGEKFDEITKNLKNRRQGIEDEFDIVLLNHTSVALIEVKYRAHSKDIPALRKKAENFRILFPDYKDFKIYLGFASMSFHPELEQECISEGIAVIKQVGDSVVINDTNLKVF